MGMAIKHEILGYKDLTPTVLLKKSARHLLF